MENNGRVRGIDLAIRRVAWKVGGQVAAGGVDRTLHVSGGAVKVSAEIELEDDGSRAKVAGRCHVGHARDAPELSLERRGDGGRHCLGASARERSRDMERWKVGLREGRNGEVAKADRAGERHAYGQQRGCDGPGDERRGNIHGRPGRMISSGAERDESPRARFAKRSNARYTTGVV